MHKFTMKFLTMEYVLSLSLSLTHTHTHTQEMAASLSKVTGYITKCIKLIMNTINEKVRQ
jgi:hypothetical protein